MNTEAEHYITAIYAEGEVTFIACRCGILTGTLDQDEYAGHVVAAWNAHCVGMTE